MEHDAEKPEAAYGPRMEVVPALRHSLATILRNRGVARWDLEGFMGHDVTGSTATYAVGRFATVTKALEEVLGEIDLRAPGALRRNCAEVALSVIPSRKVKMTG